MKTILSLSEEQMGNLVGQYNLLKEASGMFPTWELQFVDEDVTVIRGGKTISDIK